MFWVSLKLSLGKRNEMKLKHMKAPKILFASLLALSAAGVAQAQTVVHITGSTAFRGATVAAITNILQPGFTFAYAGATFSSANQAIFTGTAITNNISVTIKTSWTGSLAGIETVSQAVPSTVGTFLTNSTLQSTGGTPNAPAVYDPPLIPEVCMSDGFQATSQYPSPVLQAQTVGVVTFKFLKNVGAPTSLTNMTPLLAQALWNNGSLPLSLFSGNSNDVNTTIYAIGRDPDSGTRKTAFLETGVQTFVSALTPAIVLQYEPTNASGVVNKANPAAITGQQPWPAETVDNINFVLGDAGYSSGGDLAWAMRATSPFIYVTYLGLSDAATAEAGSAVELTYNGIPYSDAAVQNGQYTYWTFEQLDYLPTYGTTDANGKAVADSLAQEIINVDAALAGELLATMNVTRTQEGGPVTPQ
jgi:hypothetical protein